MKVTVQKRYRDVEFRKGEYLEIRLRAKRLGKFKERDKVDVIEDMVGNLILRKC